VKQESLSTTCVINLVQHIAFTFDLVDTNSIC